MNAARGNIVNESALYDALKTGEIRGAGLDVLAMEPAEKDHPLFTLENIVISPHIAGVTRQAWAKLFQVAWDNVERVLAGNDPINRV